LAPFNFCDRGNPATAKSGNLRYCSVMQQTRGAELGSFVRTGTEGTMRKVLGLVGATLLFAGPALAADLGRPPVYKAPALVPVFSWTGWYIGGNIGYGWGENTDPLITTNIFSPAFNFYPSLSPKGVIGGGQIGYDWQVNPTWVVGVVADFQGADIKDSGASTFLVGPLAVTESLSEKLDFLGTVRVRLGWAAGNWLFYGSGGGAYGNVKSTIGFSESLAGVTAAISGSRSESRAGWAAGGGINYAVTPNWILGVDYLHYDLGHTSVTASDAFGDFVTASQKVGGDIVRGVINYKF
jgi:outer membrane immunogenic protein